MTIDGTEKVHKHIIYSYTPGIKLSGVIFLFQTVRNPFSRDLTMGGVCSWIILKSLN